MKDVRQILGEPSDARDVAAYTKAYPGDEKAKRPVFTYQLNGGWELLVYFNKYCFQGYGYKMPSSLDDTVCSLDLLPKKKVPFGKIEFPSSFKTKPVEAMDGAWTEYADGSGLAYEVYTLPGPYSQLTHGDLFRIVYTASDTEFKARSIGTSK